MSIKIKDLLPEMMARSLLRRFGFKQLHENMEARKKFLKEAHRFNEKFERKCKASEPLNLVMRFDKRMMNWIQLHKIKTSFILIFAGLAQYFGMYPCKRDD